MLDAVYATNNPVHQSSLLKAVRTTYNIFLLSRNSANQNIAQVTLTQMVDHIFRRIKVNPTAPSVTSINEMSPTEEKHQPSKTQEESANEHEPHDTSFQEQIIVEANIARSEMDRKLPAGKASDNSEFLNDTANVFQDEEVSTHGNSTSNLPSEAAKHDDVSTTQSEPDHTSQAEETLAEEKKPDTTEKESDDGYVFSLGTRMTNVADIMYSSDVSRGSFENDTISTMETESDLYIKDAILVFRALCKLSKKPISSEWYDTNVKICARILLT